MKPYFFRLEQAIKGCDDVLYYSNDTEIRSLIKTQSATNMEGMDLMMEADDVFETVIVVDEEKRFGVEQLKEFFRVAGKTLIVVSADSMDDYALAFPGRKIKGYNATDKITMATITKE